MSVIEKLERKFRRLRLPNLIYIFVGAFVLGYVLNYVAPVLLLYLCFSAPGQSDAIPPAGFPKPVTSVKISTYQRKKNGGSYGRL